MPIAEDTTTAVPNKCNSSQNQISNVQATSSTPLTYIIKKYMNFLSIFKS